MYQIKQIPEDFIVIEESSIQPQKEGRYAYFKLWKREYTTLRAIEHIASFLNLPLKDFGFAGTKDKEAITEQAISIKHGSATVLHNFKNNDIKLTFLGYGNKPISLGDLKGNYFEIVIRNLEPHESPKPISFTINYFDDQRFSVNNASIGKAIVQGKFEEACQLIDDEPKNYIGALHKLSLKALQLYIHAYQSFLFNEALTEYLRCKYCSDELITLPYVHGKLIMPKEKPTITTFPLVGFGTEYPDTESKAIYTKLLQHDKITERHFIIRAFPELSAEGEMRNIITEMQRWNIEKLENDDLTNGKKKCKITFFLQKGSYATLVIKRMMI